MADWLPYQPAVFQSLAEELKALPADQKVLNPPGNNWPHARKTKLTQALHFSADDGGERMVNLVIAAAEHTVTTQAPFYDIAKLEEMGWIYVPHTAVVRITNLEADVADIKQKVDALTEDMVTVKAGINDILARLPAAVTAPASTD